MGRNRPSNNLGLIEFSSLLQGMHGIRPDDDFAG
jgi:hypothetical protein